MKKLVVLFLTLSTILKPSCATQLPDCSKPCDGSISQNFFQWRAFSSYSSRELFELKTMYYADSNRDFWQGTFAIAPEYMQNFNDATQCGCKSLGSLPFWSGSNVMTYGNNDTEGSDLDAYQFGCGDVIGTGTIQLNAQVVHVGADLLLHMTYHKDKPGFYFTLRAPLGAMCVTSQLCEEVAPHDEVADAITETVWLSYPSHNNQFQSMTQAFQAGSVNCSEANAIINSAMYKPFDLEKGRISDCKQVAIRLADISLALGYQFVATKNGFLGAAVKFTCPTGNVPTGRYIFEPVFGRAGYWGVGAELLTHYKLWEHKKRDRVLDFWAKGEFLHLCSGRRPNMRSFDLALNGPGSKYLLLQKYYPSVPTSTNPSGQVPSFITQAVNVTTMPVISRFNIEGSFAFLFDFHEQDWNLALGAEVWGRSQERLSLDTCNLINTDSADLSQFVVLGRQVSDDARAWVIDPQQEILSLHLCQPTARINKSIDRVVSPTDPVNPTPPPAGQPLAYPTDIPEGVEDARLMENHIPANLYEALDIAGAQAARAITAKIFSQLGYTWRDHCLTPQLSMIGGLEFAPGNNHAALNMWSIGAQGSINF